jgi:hypothetical protein
VRLPLLRHTLHWQADASLIRGNDPALQYLLQFLLATIAVCMSHPGFIRCVPLDVPHMQACGWALVRATTLACIAIAHGAPLCRKMYNPHWFQIPGLTGPHWQKTYILKTQLAGVLRNHIGFSIMDQLGADFQTPRT